MELLEHVKTLGDLYSVDFIGIAGISQIRDEIKSISGELIIDYTTIWTTRV